MATYRSWLLVIFINSPEQLDCVVDLYTALTHLYSFTYIGSDHSLTNPHLTLCYTPTGREDSTECVEIYELLYLNRRLQIGESSSGSSLKKEKYAYSLFEKYEIRNSLYQSWNKHVDEGTLAQEKARYKQYEDVDYDEKNNRYSGTVNIAGVSVKVYFLLTSPERMDKNIAA